MKKAIVLSLWLCVIFGLVGCGVDETAVLLIVNGPTSLVITDKPVEGIYDAVGFNGEIWETKTVAKTTTYSSNTVGPYFWYILFDCGNGEYAVASNPITSIPTCKATFSVAGTYVVFVEPGATFKSGIVTNAELASRQKLTVIVSKGQGYKETGITPRFTIEEWYPGFITVDASRTTTNPITDEVVGWKWYLDGKKFSSQREAGVPVTEGTHKIRLEVKTLFGFSQYLETDYFYKSGAASVEIKGSTGGSATGGASGIIDNPYVPPVDNSGEIPKPVAGRDGNLDLSFNKGTEIEAKKGQEVRMPVIAYGLSDHIVVPNGAMFYDGGLLTFVRVESAGDGWIVAQNDAKKLAFSAINPSPKVDTIVCYLVFKATNNATGPAGVTWPGIASCSAGYDDGNGLRGLFLRGIDSTIRVK